MAKDPTGEKYGTFEVLGPGVMKVIQSRRRRVSLTSTRVVPVRCKCGVESERSLDGLRNTVKFGGVPNCMRKGCAMSVRKPRKDKGLPRRPRSRDEKKKLTPEQESAVEVILTAIAKNRPVTIWDRREASEVVYLRGPIPHEVEAPTVPAGCRGCRVVSVDRRKLFAGQPDCPVHGIVGNSMAKQRN